MKIPKLKPGDAIEVVWIDACSHDNGEWIVEDEYTERDGGMLINSVGIYLQTKGECVMFAGDRHVKDGFRTRVARCFDIPLGCVKSIRRLA